MDAPNATFATTPLLEDIQQAGHQATELIREMLTYAGKDSLVLTDVHLNATILDMWRLVERAHPKNVSLTHDLDGDLLPVLGDATRIQQAILNLIINASDAMGTNVGSITVRTRLVSTKKVVFDESFNNPLPKSANCVVLEVSDTGSGIDDGVVAKLFEPFFSTKKTGRGLGLAIVHGVVNRHNGTISVKSQIGHGTTFSIYFPALEQTHAKAIESKIEHRQTPCSKGLILVVDDEDRVRGMADRILTHSGFSTLCASNGFEAIECFKQRQDEIDCVLLDLRMPLISGEETLEQLRLIDDKVKVVLVSGNLDPDEATKLRVSRFVQKPYSKEDVTRALSDAIAEQF
jgi:CheY-like chemotaxis protein